MRSLALANQKGGVGKTTTAIHLAHGLALAGKQVVIYDLDPQGNATLAVQGMAEQENAEQEAAGQDPGSPFAALQPLAPGLWILPSPGARRNIAATTRPDVGKLQQLARALEYEGVEWLIVDCPPRMDAWGIAGLEICERALLPVQAEFFAMHGLGQMMATIEQTRKRCPHAAHLFGVLVTMLDRREPIAVEVLQDLRANLGDKLCEAAVFRDSRFIEAASHGVTLFDYDLQSKGARSYGELVREVLYGRATIG